MLEQVNPQENLILENDPMDDCGDCGDKRYWHNDPRVVDDVTPHCSRLGATVHEHCKCKGFKKKEETNDRAGKEEEA